MSVYFEVYEIVKDIPRGRILTYGLISNLLEKRLSAQGVGWALRALSNDKTNKKYHSGNVPWHRVLRASGHIAFPVDSADFQRQKNKLLAEGCSVTTKGLVIAAIAVDDSLDSQLWSGFFRP